MIERPRSGERAILVHTAADGAPDTIERDEFVELATSAGAIVVDQLVSARKKPDARFFIGKGKLEELSESVKKNDAELIILSAALSPSQERNLEKSLSCRVVDRSGLILDIFAQRARTFEGKLQVELAQLRHLSTRLVRGWTHPRTAKGRHRPAWAWRNSAGDRPSPHRQTDSSAKSTSRPGRQAAVR